MWYPKIIHNTSCCACWRYSTNGAVHAHRARGPKKVGAAPAEALFLQGAAGVQNKCSGEGGVAASLIFQKIPSLEKSRGTSGRRGGQNLCLAGSLRFRNPCGSEPLGEEEGLELAVVRFAIFGEKEKGIVLPVGHFFQGVFEAEGDDLIGVRSSSGETLFEVIFVGGHDEEVHEGCLDGGVFAGADECGALDVDIHYYVLATIDGVEDFRFQSAVVISMDFGMFEEFSDGDVGLEGFLTMEKVVSAIDFSFSGLPGRAGNGVMRQSLLGEATAKCCFSRARRARDEVEDAGARHFLKSGGKFSVCQF